MSIAKVEPLLKTRKVRGPFDYRIPERMEPVEVGSVLVVPFGRRKVVGVVVERSERSEVPEKRLVEPHSALEAGVPPELVELGLWISEEYCSIPARGLALVLPPGIGTGAEARRVKPLVETEAEITEAGRAALNGGERLGVRQRAALRALLGGARRARALAAEAGADRATLRRLETRGLISTEEVERRRRPKRESVGSARTVELNAAQEAARDRVVAALQGSKHASVLLHGVTGSGKTEVYLAAAAAAIELGRGAIVLVPEIALTPQTVSRFRARFGEKVALLHSRMSAGARYDEWRRLRSGEAAVCVGPRSAVFAPVRDLGLIVIDEEHDSSYKQESDPRYDAREVAAERARRAGAVLVAGTATPRVESWRSLPRIDLPHRVDGQPLPPVEVVDMRGTVAGPLHERTIEAFGRVAAGRGKAILLVNRRGWSPLLSCHDCGHDWRCGECDVSLVLHRDRGLLRCHHCGHSERPPEACPACGSVGVARLGAGTQRVEAELEKLVAPLPVFRLDADSAARDGGHAAILGAFERAESGVLVGTQMVAKGHDFPDVTLSVILDADAALRIPDFRAEERTFALITQLAGRSGRGRAGGTVLVQALAVGAPSVTHAAHHDAAGFLAGELERREALGYPPFSHLIEVGLAAPAEEPLDEAAAGLGRRISAALPAGCELLGPAPLFRVRGRHRRRLLVKAPRRRAAVAAVREAVRSAAAEGALQGSALSVDVDPQ